MSRTRIVVTGLGATTPLGGDVDSTWQAMLAGRSGVKRLNYDWVEDQPSKIGAEVMVDPTEVLERVEARRMDRAAQLAVVAAREAWADAGFGFGEDNPVESTRLASIVATGIGGMRTLLGISDTLRERGVRRVSPLGIPMLMANSAAANVGLRIGAQAGVHTPVSACASSNEAIALGLDQLRLGRADVAVVGGTEGVVHPLPMAAFAQMQALSRRNDDPERASRPWDVDRDGFVLAEGAALMVIETLEHAQARGARIYGELAGAGISADGHDMVQPDPTGVPQSRAMVNALHEADLTPADIRHVNAHATSTPTGDGIEAESIRLALGDAVDDCVVTATKSMTGHLLGGAGALESMATLLALYHRTVPPTINLDHPEDGLGIDIAVSPRELPSGDLAGLNNSFGFGGHNVAVAFTNAFAGSPASLAARGRPHPAGSMPMSVTPRSDPRHPRRRLATLLDDGTLRALTDEDDSGMLAVTGDIHGVPVVAFCCDPTVMGGALGVAGCEVVVRAYERALADQVPILGLWHSGGARLAEGLMSLHAVGGIFSAMTRASGVIPQLSIVLGLAAGGAAYAPGLADIVVLAPQGRIFVTGPDVVRSVTGEEVDQRRLGGPDAHGRRSGVAHVVAEDEADALSTGRTLIALLADQGRMTEAPDTDLATCLPEARERTYDVHPLVAALLDEGTGVELHAQWAPNIVTVLGRLAGRTVGVVANNPMRLGGCLDAISAEKAARFVRTCDVFGIPLAVLEDVPGYLPGVDQEWEGVVRRGAKLLHAFAEAVVPRATLITRMAYGGAALAMNSRALGATRVYAWPGADVAVMAPLAAVRVLHRRRLAAVPESVRPGLEAELAAELERLSGGVQQAVDAGVIDAVVQPSRTRSALARALAQADHGQRGRHTNIPL